MTTEERIEQEINKTLGSIDGITRAEAAAFFYTRLAARMEKRPSGIIRVISRPVLSLGVLLLLLVLNITAIAHYVKAGEQNVQDTSGLESLASEMSRDISSVYDKTNN